MIPSDQSINRINPLPTICYKIFPDVRLTILYVQRRPSSSSSRKIVQTHRFTQGHNKAGADSTASLLVKSVTFLSSHSNCRKRRAHELREGHGSSTHRLSAAVSRGPPQKHWALVNMCPTTGHQEGQTAGSNSETPGIPKRMFRDTK